MFGPFDAAVGALVSYLDEWRSRTSGPDQGPISTLHLQNGMILSAPSKSPSFQRMKQRSYEAEVVELLARILRPGRYVVDVGANVGYHTLAMSMQAGEGGHVFAFEPDPATYQILVTNLTNNRCTNVTSVPMAVGSKPGISSFVPFDVERGFVSERHPTHASIDVETTSLDVYFAGIGWPKIDLIKMDIEGAEYEALRGMRELCRRNLGLKLVMEYNLATMHRAGVSLASLTSAIKDCGFSECRSIEAGFKALPMETGLPKSRIVSNLLLSRTSSNGDQSNPSAGLT